MKSAKGEMFWNTGTYEEVVPNEKIVSMMFLCSESGRAIPASHWGIENV
jgi:hypothetical protein